MSKQVFARIDEGLEQAQAIGRGEVEPAGIHVLAEINVRQICAKTKLPQEMFAALLRFTVYQTPRCEQYTTDRLASCRRT